MTKIALFKPKIAEQPEMKEREGGEDGLAPNFALGFLFNLPLEFGALGHWNLQKLTGALFHPHNTSVPYTSSF